MNKYFCICILAAVIASCRGGHPGVQKTGSSTPADTIVIESIEEDSSDIWQRELQGLVRLYEEAEPEQTSSPLREWCRVDIDDDGIDEVLLRSSDKRYGAFFTMEKEPALICTESPQRRAKLYKGRIRTSDAEGRAGFRYTNYIIKDSHLAHTFVKLEVYGELRECTRDGRPISYDESLTYQESLSREELSVLSLEWYPIE